MEEIAVDVRSSAPRERVWELLTDTVSWADWAPFKSASVATPGPGEPEGVGMVRRLGRGMGQVTVERITEFDSPARFAYELISGVPVKDYSAVVTLTEADAGTLISWRSSSRQVPGSGRAGTAGARAVHPPVGRGARAAAERS